MKKLIMLFAVVFSVGAFARTTNLAEASLNSQYKIVVINIAEDETCGFFNLIGIYKLEIGSSFYASYDYDTMRNEIIKFTCETGTLPHGVKFISALGCLPPPEFPSFPFIPPSEYPDSTIESIPPTPDINIC